MDKKALAEQILSKGGSLFVTFNPREAVVPTAFKGEKLLTLQYGHNLPKPIPDLHIGNDGISATLSFFGGQLIETFVPWNAVEQIFDDKGTGMSWVLFAKAGQASITDFKAPPKKPALRLIQGGKSR